MPKKLRDCAVCHEDVLDVPYQDKGARTCSPTCAQRLARQEHPDLETSRDKRDHRLAKLYGEN